MIWALLAKRKWADLLLIDTYSTQNFYYAVITARLARWLRIPYYPILHGGNLPNRLNTSPSLSKHLFGNAKCNISPSYYLIEEYRKAGYQNLEYIPNVIDLDNYLFTIRTVIRPKLLWVRAFNKIYNPVLALETLELLLEIYPEAELCMIGPDKDGSMANCEQIAREKKLPVTFTGKMEKEAWIAHSKNFDLFINTTNLDNTPVSVIEAMALGLTVVSTDVGGIPFLIEHQKDGILVPPNDAVSFVQAIKGLVEEPLGAQQITRAARRKAETFDWAQVKEQWFALFKD